MTTLPIGELGLEANDVTALRNAGITTSEQFWQSMAGNKQLLQHIFDKDVDARKRVFSQMIQAGISESRELGSPWFSRLLPDLVVITAIVLVLYGFMRDPQKTPPKPPVQQVVVTAMGGLPAFHAIEPGAVSLRALTPQDYAATSVSDVIGRYSTSPLKQGDVVSTKNLSASKLSSALQDRKLVQLKLQPSILLSGAALPVAVSLLASPRMPTAEKGWVLDGVLVLSTSAQSDGSLLAVVAVKNSDEQILATLVGISDLVVSVPGA